MTSNSMADGIVSSGGGSGEAALSDAHLACAAAAGDREAAGALIYRHQRTVRWFLRRLTGCDATADDLAQETLVRMLRYAHRYDANYPMRTWLLTIARRLWINHGRAAGRVVAAGDGCAAMLSAEVDPAQRVARAENDQHMRLLLAEAMKQLSDGQREALLLFHQQGLSVEEAAEVMGVPVNTVKSHLHRGRATLRRKLSHLAEIDP